MTDEATISPSALKDKVIAWLDSEGFPTEFRTARAFREALFDARQGRHYRTSGTPREIDVVASKTLREDQLWVRCEFVVECKWTAKPWVVFTDEYSRIGPAACVAQTMGSKAGQALLWLSAGASDLQALKMFSTPPRPGFGGRQVLSRGDDQFYKAMAAVTTASAAIAAGYDEGRVANEAPRSAVCVFPVIVIEGALFEGFYDNDAAAMTVQATEHVRCHWKGAPEWDWHATVDIVTLAGLPDYLAALSPDVQQLLEAMRGGLKPLREAFETGSLAPLEVRAGSRGMVGLHPFLAEINGSSSGPSREP